MKFLRRPKLFAEQLEDRTCPSFVFRLVDSTLFITGTPKEGGVGAGVVLTQTANNQWSFADHGTTILSKVSVDNISLSVTQHFSDSITFNFGGFTDTGNITVNLGNGDNSQSAQDGVAFYNGTLAGNLLLLNGSGEERVHLGYVTTGPGSATALPMTIGGNVQWIAKENPSLATPGNPQGNIFDTGTEPATATAGGGFVPSAVVIGGSVTAVGVSALQFPGATTVGGNVSQTMLRDAIFVGGAGDLFFGTVGGNVTVQGATASPRDLIQIGGPSIGGNLSINLGNGSNELEVLSTSTVQGNTNVQMGDGNNMIGMGGTYNGSLAVHLGNGNNTDGSAAPDFITPDAFFGSTASVGGNFSVTAGNGNNSLTTTGNAFAGSVGGNTNFNFGNGADSVTVSSSTLGGKFNWTSGNGADSLTFAGATAGTTYNTNVVFGNNDDSFTFNDTGSFLTGSVNGGGRLAANHFNFVAGTIEQPFTLSNFP